MDNNFIIRSKLILSRRRMLEKSLLLTIGAAGAASFFNACGDYTTATSGQASAPATFPASTASGSTGASSLATVPATAGSSAPQVLSPVRMACWSQPISEQSNIYASQEYGWFKEQGLDFTFVPGAGGGDALKNILAGNAEFAFTNVEPTLFAIQEGAKLKGIYNIYPQNVFNLVTLKTSGINSISDLKGKKIGVYSQTSGTRYNLLVMLKSAGLKESDVEVVATGVANFSPLKEGKVVATAATDTGLFAAQKAGIGDVNVFYARDILNTPSDIFVVTEETYQRKKDIILRFLKAYKKGSQWMLDNPDKASELAVKYATDGKDVKQNRAIIDIRNQSTVSNETKLQGLGFFDQTTMNKVEATFLELGITKQHFEMDKIFSNEFLTQI